MFKFRFFVFLSFLLVFISCKEDNTPPFVAPDLYIDTFVVNGVSFTINDNLITGNIPGNISVDSDSLIAFFAANGTVKINDVVQESGVSKNKFAKQVIYPVYSDDEKFSRNYTVKLTSFTALPKLYIDTENEQEITSKEDYVKATFRLEPNGQYDFDVYEGSGRIRGRGNSTWGMIKKPYKIKLDAAAELFGSYPYKEWALLANYADKSLMRNYLANNLASLIGMPFAPSAHFVEVFLNGEHVGNYMLTDQIETGPTRVNIPELKGSDNSEALISGGYLLEVDFRAKEEEDAVWFESYGMPVALKSPKEPSAAQLDYITKYVNKADKLLLDYSEGDLSAAYQQYFDMESTAKWFIVNEFFKNCDASGFSSIFFYKNRDDDKLYMGPVWDFDIAAGNAAHQPACQLTDGWYVRYQPRINRLYTDPLFRQTVKEVWQQNRTHILYIIDQVDVMAQKLDLSQKKNFTLWPDFEDPSSFVIPGNKSYEGQVAYLKNFLEERFEWLDAEFSK